jgi:hypothetical protein
VTTATVHPIRRLPPPVNVSVQSHVFTTDQNYYHDDQPLLRFDGRQSLVRWTVLDLASATIAYGYIDIRTGPEGDISLWGHDDDLIYATQDQPPTQGPDGGFTAALLFPLVQTGDQHWGLSALTKDLDMLRAGLDGLSGNETNLTIDLDPVGDVTVGTDMKADLASLRDQLDLLAGTTTPLTTPTVTPGRRTWRDAATADLTAIAGGLDDLTTA